MLESLKTFQLITHFENALNAGAFEDALILSDLIQLPLRWHQLARACTTCLEFDIGMLCRVHICSYVSCTPNNHILNNVGILKIIVYAGEITF